MATQTANSAAPSDAVVQSALLFMPDISGFTEFVSTTEIEHAQCIIQEVLELIIDSNQLHLEVGEIEGDAVFFYRLGAPPPLEDLLQQVHTMFTRFHQHLRLYDLHRICPCRACTQAANLKLKIIAHYGEVAGYTVKTHRKLFGRDVILLHRLLKNNLNKKEYALLTQPLCKSAHPPRTLPDWYEAEEAKEQYDVGTIDFTIIDLSRLHGQLPPPEPPQFRLWQKTKTVFSIEKLIPAPAAQVFGPVFDLSKRVNWMDGVQRVEMLSKDLINRVGTRHRCVINPKDSPVMVTEYARVSTNEIELIEMDEKGVGGCRFLVQVLNEHTSNLKVDMLMRNNIFLLTYFNLFLKSKLKRRMEHSVENLYRLCTN